MPFLLALLVFVFCQAGAAQAAPSLDEWRSEASQARQLAENAAPRAYEDAKRLQATLPADATPADRARSLNLLSRIETYMALTEPAAAHAQQAFDLAAKNGDRVGQAESDLNVALNSINQGKLDDLVRATQHSVTVLEGMNRPDLLGEAMLRTTVMYRRFDQFDESVAVAVQAMEIARRSQNPLALTYAHQGLAVAFDQSYRVEEMREHYRQMRMQARAANSKLLEAFAMAGLASADVKAGDLSGAEQLSREAIAMYREVGVPFSLSFGLYGLAQNLAMQGRRVEALKLLDEAIASYERYPNRIGLWFALNARSENYESLGDFVRAHADAARAYAAAKDLGLALYMSGSATRLASIAAAKGDHRRAYELTVEAGEMTTKAARERAGARMVELIKRYESESKQREISELTRRNEQQNAELRQRALQQRWLWTVLGGFILALSGTALFVFRLRHSHANLEQRVQARTSELRQQARYLRTLIDMLPMWAWFKDTQSRYLAANQATADACGLPAENMVGKSDEELWPQELAQAYRSDDADVMISRQRKTAEEPVAVGGGTVWMETYKAPVLDEDGTVLGTVGVARNISDRKATEAAREAALAEAERLARQRSEFLAQMSHELRTPLNGILGFAQLLRRDKSLSERQARGLRMIDESGQHLLTLINDILDLARIDAAKLELFPTEINLSAFLHVVTDIVRVKAEEKSLLFSYEPAGRLPSTVRADEKRLRQVLLNLLSNAVKFTDDGQVTLRVQALPVGLPGEPGADSMACLLFEVHDSGIGMSEEQLALLFQPFEQVADVNRRKGGAGLGLAISRQLICLMGGDIHVRSQPGRGSVFWFEIDLPAPRPQAGVSPAHGNPIGYEGLRKSVLVVDDVAQNRAMLLDVLGMLGFQVSDAGDGLECLEAAGRTQPDLIVMDIMMPVMDGLEATRRIRRMPELAGVPIIATSASATQEMEARSRAAGADAFIAKPIEQDVMLKTMARLMGLIWIYEKSELHSAEDELDAPTTRF